MALYQGGDKPETRGRKMTEEQIERQVERMTDAADRLLMTGKLDQQAYDIRVKEIDAWAKAQLAKRVAA
jgi:hypothetical protein